jgi:hypothetical protein
VSVAGLSHDLPGWMRVNVGETHAQGIVDLAFLETAVRQGDPIKALPVHVAVSCGRPSLQIGDTKLLLATWQVLVRLELDNAAIKYGSQRRVELQSGDFESKTVTKETLSTIRDHAVALGLEGRVKGTSVAASVAGSLFAKLRWNRKKTIAGTNIASSKTISEIVLIGSLGEAIAIGDPHYGDPHKKYGLLSHTYPKDVGETNTPLFVIEPKEPSAPLRITVMTSIPFDKLCFLTGDPNEKITQLARSEIERLRDAAIESHEILRRRMLRDELASRVSQNQRRTGLPVRAGEFVVMIQMFEIRPQELGEDNGAQGD